MRDRGKTVEQSPKELIEQAEQALVNQDWDVALEGFNLALALLGPVQTGQPAALFAEAQNGKGVALLELGRYGESVKAFEAALTIKPDLPGAHYNLGLAWEGLGQLENALHNYTKAIELEPHDGEAYFRRGGVYFATEQYEKTVEDATQAIELHRADAAGAAVGPYLARGLALHRLEHYDEALADYNQALAAAPGEAWDAYFYRALVYIDKGEAYPAKADLEAFLTLTPDATGVQADQAREIIVELDKVL
jgi:tetratricopeptide (TPR) repeat protein